MSQSVTITLDVNVALYFGVESRTYDYGRTLSKQTF